MICDASHYGPPTAEPRTQHQRRILEIVIIKTLGWAECLYLPEPFTGRVLHGFLFGLFGHVVALQGDLSGHQIVRFLELLHVLRRNLVPGLNGLLTANGRLRTLTN